MLNKNIYSVLGRNVFAIFTSLNKIMWYYNLNIKAFVFLCMLLFVCACNKDDTAEKWAKEEAELAEWIKKHAPRAVFDNGIYIEIIGRRHEKNILPEHINEAVGYRTLDRKFGL